MSKYVLSSFLAASIMAALSLPAFAGNDSGTVNFAGKVVADTCEINVDGSGTTSSTVTFPDTYASDFGTDGAVGTSKTFNIEVKNVTRWLPNSTSNSAERQRMPRINV